MWKFKTVALRLASDPSRGAIADWKTWSSARRDRANDSSPRHNLGARRPTAAAALRPISCHQNGAFGSCEVECIGKGKASAPYEFGVKASIVTTNARAPGGQFVLHAKALPGNPYDGHTLGDVIDATEKLTG